MDIEAFEVLESKISQVLEKLESLREEKGELQDRYNDLQSRYTEISRELEDVTRERDFLKDHQRDNEQEELIKSRLTALLERIEAA